MSEVNAGSELSGLLPAGRVVTGRVELAEHSLDQSPGALLRSRRSAPPEPPACIVRPGSSAEVATVVTWAQSRGVPLVPFGGGSGVVEGIRPESAVVVSLSAMSRIVDIDTKSGLVTAEAGTTGPTLRDALKAEDLMLGHEPQSHDISTVGGWVATRACGQLSARYGGIEDLVAGLEAVLPTGEIVRAKPNPRRSVGPDVAALMLGSEGTLGIVTEVTLRASAIPPDRADLCIRFDHMADGVAACRHLARSDLHPTLVRLYDPEDSALFLRSHPEEEPGPLMISSFDGRDSDSRADAALELSGGKEGNQALVEHWWEHRNDAVEEFRVVLAGRGLLGPHGIVETMELSGSWTALRDLYHNTKESLGAEADFVGCHLSHIYPDGACLYFTMGSACETDAEAVRRLERWWEVGMRTCLDAGGSISHHHGIGRRKAPWLGEELGGWLQVLRAVKTTLDPNSIMNPGALGL